MSKVLDVAADPSTAIAEADEYSLDDFRKEQAAAKAENKSVEFERTSESAPPSEAVRQQAAPDKSETVSPKQAMTDAEKSARKHANDGKRIPEFLKQISAKDARIAQLEREIAAKQTPAPATAKSEARTDGAPDPNDPKYAGENGWLLFVDDRAEFKADQRLKAYQDSLKAEKATADSDAAVAPFREKLAAYQESQSERAEEFSEALDIVRDALETDFPDISAAIVAHARGPELIDYLGTNLDVFSRITSAKGQPMAMKIYKGIIADFDQPVSEATTKKSLPRPPVNLNGRGRTPSASEVQDKAAEDDDFQTWRQAEKAKPKQRSKWDR